jgi:cyclopropane fatty-acyl-phospholipid synthase-like methyltransferase
MDQKIVSLRKDAGKVEFKDLQDVVYSVSVIEHLPAKIRRSIIVKMSKWLKSGGLLLLTMDLIPGTNKLWNLSEGVKVESSFFHGNLNSVKKELKKNGFTITSENTHRNVFKSRTDVVYLVCIKN